MPDNECLLEVSHLNKDFPVKKQRLHALSDVSLTVSRGEILGILGESGCGKSTLATILSGSQEATSGQIRLKGLDYTRLKGRALKNFRRNIQMVFQDPLSSFSPRMQIGVYVAEPRRNYDHIHKEKALKEAGDLLEQVGLPRDFVRRYPHELSGGQLQRVAIARAIAIRPELLICDEATGALDVSTQARIARLLVDLVEEKQIGCIFIGHDPAFVRSVTQRIAVMYLGRLVEVLDSESLADKCLHPYTKALLDSIFDIYCDQSKDIKLLAGEPPSPLEIHEGCAFSGRCAFCKERCRKERPELREIEPGHQVACHYV